MNADCIRVLLCLCKGADGKRKVDDEVIDFGKLIFLQIFHFQTFPTFVLQVYEAIQNNDALQVRGFSIP